MTNERELCSTARSRAGAPPGRIGWPASKINHLTFGLGFMLPMATYVLREANNVLDGRRNER